MVDFSAGMRQWYCHLMNSVIEQAPDYIRDLVPYEPGKPIDDVAREWGLDPKSIIKLASNENPLGPSPKAKAAMLQAIEKAELYPDGGGFHLRTAIARKMGLEIGNVILGNGSNEILEFLGKAFLKPGDDIITARHAFAVYHIIAQMSGANTIEVPDPEFRHDLKAMVAAITPRTKLFFITTPNNPTGAICSEQEIFDAVAAIPPHIVVVIDEAYYEFLDMPPRTIELIAKYPNVILMRTFSKIQGLAALRIGYGLGSKELVEVLQKTRQPFNANAIAQAGALAGLEDEEHQRKTKEITDNGRLWLAEQFARLGLEQVPSGGNFIMVKVGGPGDGKRIFLELQKRGIIIRDLTSYQLPEYIRVTVGTPEQNARFIEEFEKVI